MSEFVIKAVVDGNRIDAITRKAKQVFGEKVEVKKLFDRSSRADRLLEAAGMVDQAHTIVEELKQEVSDWRENLPENIQEGEKASALEECEDALDELLSQFDSLEFDGIEFPGF